jgi:hypothetical protein
VAGGDLVTLASGIWLALGGCLLTALGGVMAGTPASALPYSPAPPASFDGLAFEPEPQPEVS